ncbi:MAG: hypothetical protein M1324_03590 [Patescibacteria group bacterium]|nr:hypothetical protein [Patescibacteria group bacterium]
MEYRAKINGYGKKSIWRWIIIYVVAAVVIYAGIFLVYREFRDRGTDDSGSTTTQSNSLY